MSKFLLLFFLIISIECISKVLEKTIFIEWTELELVDSSKISTIIFSENHSSENPLHIKGNLNDTLNLKVINLDSIKHSISIQKHLKNKIMEPKDTLDTTIYLNQNGSFIIYEGNSFPNHHYSSISGLLTVASSSYSTFYWNIREFQKAWNRNAFAGTPLNRNEYYPDYFTVNNRSNPNIDADTNSRVIGKVGDTIQLVIANTGLSVHSIHFHGYHAKIISSNLHTETIGREKDTFPIYPMEIVKLEFVPNKKGIYPVHDHNLIGVTGGMYYPNGMFSTLKISPK